MWEELGNKTRMNIKRKKKSTTCMWAVKNNCGWLLCAQRIFICICCRGFCACVLEIAHERADVYAGCKTVFNLFVASGVGNRMLPGNSKHTRHTQPYVWSSTLVRVHAESVMGTLIDTFSPTNSATKERCFNNMVNYWIMMVFGAENTKCHFNDWCKPSSQQAEFVPNC